MKNKLECIGDVKILNNVIIAESHSPINLPEGEYQITIESIPRKRSLRQNKYLWALIGEIAKKEDGDLRNIDTLYCHLLEMAGAKYKVLYIEDEAINDLIQFEIVRHVVIKKKKVVNHKIMDEVYIFYGSSKMETNEMSDLIETTLRYATKFGEINTPYWEELLKG